MRKLDKKTAGYTLLEMAVVASVLGAVLLSGSAAYNVYARNKSKNETENSINLVVNYLGNFLIQNGRYPCPARADARRDEADYGRESCAGGAAAAGTCANGICVEDSGRQVDTNPDAAVTTLETVKVMRGAVPFRDLGLPEIFAQDGYKMRLSYAVTAPLSNTATYQKMNGGIDVVDGQDMSLLEPASSAHFAVFSAGRNKAGAFSAQGGAGVPCPANNMDTENCNTSPANPVARYRQAQHSTAENAQYFDDVIKFYSSIETPLWRISSVDGNHIRDLIDVPGGGKIGINKANPVEAVDIVGTIKASNDLMAAQVANKDGTSPFPVSCIGDECPQFQCPPGEYVTRVGDARVYCSPATELRCPSGSVMTGLGAGGTLQCQPYFFQGCPATPIKDCDLAGGNVYPNNYNEVNGGVAGGYTATLPQGNQGDSINPFLLGHGTTRQFGYLCNNGAWEPLYQSGSCTMCQAGVWQYVQSQVFVPGDVCNAVPAIQAPLGWAGGIWTGTVTFEHTIICPDPDNGIGYTNTWLPVANTCACQNGVDTEVNPCPQGQTGSITRTRNWTCSGATAGTWGPWNEVNSCVCTPSAETQQINCPVGYDGTWTQTRNLTCPAGTWGAWTPAAPPAGQCTNCVGATQTENNIPCPPGQAGTQSRERTFNCATNDWNPWVITGGNCVAVTYSWAANSGVTGTSGSHAGPEVGANCGPPGTSVPACWSAAGGGQFNNYSSCVCQ